MNLSFLDMFHVGWDGECIIYILNSEVFQCYFLRMWLSMFWCHAFITPNHCVRSNNVFSEFSECFEIQTLHQVVPSHLFMSRVLPCPSRNASLLVRKVSSSWWKSQWDLAAWWDYSYNRSDKEAVPPLRKQRRYGASWSLHRHRCLLSCDRARDRLS